jgi:hypothetical protein
VIDGVQGSTEQDGGDDPKRILQPRQKIASKKPIASASPTRGISSLGEGSWTLARVTEYSSTLNITWSTRLGMSLCVVNPRSSIERWRFTTVQYRGKPTPKIVAQRRA